MILSRNLLPGPGYHFNRTVEWSGYFKSDDLPKLITISHLPISRLPREQQFIVI
jgi:hypothetical protein